MFWRMENTNLGKRLGFVKPVLSCRGVAVDIGTVKAFCSEPGAEVVQTRIIGFMPHSREPGIPIVKVLADLREFANSGIRAYINSHAVEILKECLDIISMIAGSRPVPKPERLCASPFMKQFAHSIGFFVKREITQEDMTVNLYGLAALSSYWEVAQAQITAGNSVDKHLVDIFNTFAHMLSPVQLAQVKEWTTAQNQICLFAPGPAVPAGGHDAVVEPSTAALAIVASHAGPANKKARRAPVSSKATKKEAEEGRNHG